MEKKVELTFSERVATELLGWELRTLHVHNVYEKYKREAWVTPLGGERVLPDFGRDWGAVEEHVLPLLRGLHLSVAAFTRRALWEAHVHAEWPGGKTRSFSTKSDFLARAVCSAALKAKEAM